MLELNDGPTSSALPGLLGPAPADLRLRVCGGPYAGQELRLTGRKCAIGSSQTCTLRIESPDVSPVHCLILRGALGTVVRRLAADCRLNGAAFSEALLHTGDRLAIGPFELEVAGENPSNATAQDWDASVADATRELSARLQERDEQLQTAVNDATRLSRELDSLRNQYTELQSQRDALRLPQAEHVQLEAENADLRGQIQQFVLERERAEQLRRKLESALRQQTNKADQGQQLAEEVTALRERCRELQTELQEHGQNTQRVSELEAELLRAKRESKEFASERTRFAAERQAWQTERKQLGESRLPKPGVSDIAHAPAPPAEPVPRETAARGKTAARGDMATQAETAARTDRAVRGDTAVPVGGGGPTRSNTPSTESSEEEAIEAYMERLLRRARGESEQDSAALMQAKKRRATSIWRVADQPNAMEDTPPVSETLPTATQESPVRKTLVENTNIEALREVANYSARSAIDRHTRERYARSLWLNSLWVVVTVGFDAFCWYLVVTRSTDTSIVCAVAGLIPVALFCEKVRRALRLKRVYQTAARINCL